MYSKSASGGSDSPRRLVPPLLVDRIEKCDGAAARGGESLRRPGAAASACGAQALHRDFAQLTRLHLGAAC